MIGMAIRCFRQPFRHKRAKESVKESAKLVLMSARSAAIPRGPPELRPPVLPAYLHLTPGV